MSDLGNNAREQLAGFIERLESLMTEKAQVSEKIKAEFAEAAAVGFDKKALKQLLKERQSDMQSTAEYRAIVETYRKALGDLGDTELGQWASAFMAAEQTSRSTKREVKAETYDDKKAKRSANDKLN